MGVKGKQISVETQLKLWVKGESVHNASRNECTPDFSCCRPELLAAPAVRAEYAMASADRREQMCIEFLARALRSKGFEVVA